MNGGYIWQISGQDRPTDRYMEGKEVHLADEDCEMLAGG